MDYHQITFEQRGRVGLITLNRPEKLNAWTAQMQAEYRDAIERANADPGIGAIVSTGAGRAFCAGADIGGFAAKIASEPGGATPSRAGIVGGDWDSFIATMPKPTIAAINGPAIGVGITHALSLDIRIASENARIGFVFVKMGLVPEYASSHYLPQMAGYARALEWCLTGRMILAQEAKEAGLVSEVVAPEHLLDRALALGEELSNHPPMAMGLIKQLLRGNTTDGDIQRVQQRETDALAKAYASPEHKEAVAAFIEKRPANFNRR